VRFGRPWKFGVPADGDGRALGGSTERLPRDRPSAGFTLIELLLVLALITTLAAIGIPIYFHSVEKAKQSRAIGDINAISTALVTYFFQNGAYPDSLAAVGFDTLKDPWGSVYQYLAIDTAKGNGKLRKDKNLVPLNTDFDLYSMGPDGDSSTPLTAKNSRDDIVRANNGAFVGLASDY
jgi:general secretion pathway protein G